MEKNKNFVNSERCWFLLLTSLFFLIFMGFLNGSIIYLVIKYLFFEDGWSFIAAFYISISLIITIPALIFAIISFNSVLKGNKRKLPSIFGFLLIASSLLFHNATVWWKYILALGLLLIISVINCKKKERKK